MASIVGGLAVSHTSAMISSPDSIEPGKLALVHAAYAECRAFIETAGPDVIVMLGTDHFNSFFLDNLPQVCVGIAERHQGWADNIPMTSVVGSPEFGHALARGLVEREIDASLSMNLRIDHSFCQPLLGLVPDLDIPVVPVALNTITPPLMPVRRAARIGTAIRDIVREVDLPSRVLMIASGGISHWPGLPEQGRVNEDFDREFIQRFLANDLPWFENLSTDYLGDVGGNGAQEVRMLVALRAAMGSGSAASILYEPLPGWRLGYSVMSVSAEVVK